MSEWYFVKEGKQEGPVTAQQLSALVKSGIIDANGLLVWREGLPEWTAWENSSVLEEAAQAAVAPIPAPSLAAAPQTVVNPYQLSERSRNALSNDHSYVPPGYPGIGRIRYVLSTFLATLVGYGITAGIVFAIASNSKASFSTTMMTSGIIVILIMGAMSIVCLYFGVQRVRNLGMSGYAILWSFVPFMNVWIGWRMLACPEGYEDHRTLDIPGKVISGIWGLFILLAILSAVFEN